MGNHENSESVLNELGDPRTRKLLAIIDENSRSVKELAEELDASKATIYRRLEILEEHELVLRNVTVSADGNHYTVYESNFIRASITVEDEGFDVRVARKDEYPNRLTEIWDALRNK